MQEKPKKKRGLIVVAALLVLLAAGYFGLTVFLENDQLNKEAIAAEELQVTAFAKVDSFSYSDDAGNTMSYSYNGIDWVCAQHETFPLVYSRVQDMANAFADIIAERALEEHAELAEYGLDTPKYTLDIVDGEYAATVLFGNPASTGWYVMVEGGETVYVVDAALIEEFVFDVYDILKYDRLPGFLQDEVQAVDFTHNGRSYHFSLTHEEDNQNSVSTVDGAPIDIPYIQVMDALKIVDDLVIRGCALYGAEEEQLPEYGFNEPLFTMEIDIYDVSEDMSKVIKIVAGGIDESGNMRYFMGNDNMQVLLSDNADAEGIVLDLTTVGLEELPGGIQVEDLLVNLG